jgi:hypothetical protein
MVVNANLSKNVYDYYKGHDLSKVADTLLEMYDFTNLPQCAIRIDKSQRKECKINVSNEYYISLYETLGPRSKKLSLGRLFEFGYNMDVLALPRFESMRVDNQNDDPTHSLIDRAYRALLLAQKYDTSEELKQLTKLIYNYREMVK